MHEFSLRNIKLDLMYYFIILHYQSNLVQTLFRSSDISKNEKLYCTSVDSNYIKLYIN